MEEDKQTNGGPMRRLSTLFTRTTPGPTHAASRRAPIADAAAEQKPRPRRSLNEGGHKLDR
jgi:hypothetical protein